MKSFNYQGSVVSGTIESTYKSSGKTSYFLKVQNVPEEIQCTSRGGNLWPIEGSLLLVDKKDRVE